MLTRSGRSTTFIYRGDMSDVNKTRSMREGLLVLNQAFTDHCVSDERFFAEIVKVMNTIPEMSNALARIEGKLEGEDKELEGIKHSLKDHDERLRSIERWKWGMMGAIPVLTILGMLILKHVFKVEF